MKDYTKLSIDECLLKLQTEDDFNPQHLLDASTDNPNLAAAFYLDSHASTYRSRFIHVNNNAHDWISENVKVPVYVFANLLRDKRCATLLLTNIDLTKNIIGNNQALADAIFDNELIQNYTYRKLLFQQCNDLFKLTGSNPRLLDFIFKDAQYLSELLSIEQNKKNNGPYHFYEIASLATEDPAIAFALYSHPLFIKCAGSKAFVLLGKTSIDVASQLVEKFRDKFTPYELFELALEHEEIFTKLTNDKKFVEYIFNDQSGSILLTLAAKHKSIALAVLNNQQLWEIVLRSNDDTEIYNILSKWPDLIATAFQKPQILYRMRANETYFENLVAKLNTQNDDKSRIMAANAPLQKVFVVKVSEQNSNPAQFDSDSKNGWWLSKDNCGFICTEDNVDWLLGWHKKYNLASELFECYASTS